jgi:hypothetical protein
LRKESFDIEPFDVVKSCLAEDGLDVMREEARVDLWALLSLLPSTAFGQ